jgi:HTH-type transcriptional regulator/antitoxin HigA
MSKQTLKDKRELLSKPGDTILETIGNMKMSQVDLATRIGKTPSKVNDIIAGKEPITVVTALQLENVLGIAAQFWLNREMLYREQLFRIEQEEALQDAEGWLDQLPVKELKRAGHISTEKKGVGMITELLKFFSVASPVQWEAVYIDHYTTTNLRKNIKGKSHQTKLGSMSAWLRIGEVEMKKINPPAYNKDAFKKSLSVIRSFVAKLPDDFSFQLQALCKLAGVALVYTAPLPDAPIKGGARWFGGNPLIQLANHYKAIDHFWFTFFHEAAHVLLHGKKDVFIEDFEGYALDEKKEMEANEFAADYLLPSNFVNDLPEKITPETVLILAKKYNAHPAIVAGRLASLKLVPPAFGKKFQMEVTLV